MVGQILAVKIKMEETGIQIITNGKIKILIQIKNVHGKIIYLHRIIIISIINGMEIIIIIITDKPIMINGNLLINPNLSNNNNNNNSNSKINNYLILKQIQLLFMLRQVVNTMYNIINIQLHYNKLWLHNNQAHQ